MSLYFLYVFLVKKLNKLTLCFLLCYGKPFKYDFRHLSLYEFGKVSSLLLSESDNWDF